MADPREAISRTIKAGNEVVSKMKKRRIRELEHKLYLAGIDLSRNLGKKTLFKCADEYDKIERELNDWRRW
jgi:hypothetical protein